jgi:hypothetical protein
LTTGGWTRARRHTFGAHLSRNGLATLIAQEAIRPPSLDLTMNVYTAPTLLDVAGAAEALPGLSLERAAAAALSQEEPYQLERHKTTHFADDVQ